MSRPHLYKSADGDYLSRWKRIVHLDVRLREGSWPSAVQLARECGVCAKTVYRDIEAMRSELRAPIEYDASRKGFGYSDAGFAIPAASLNERDLFALMVAENAVEQYAGTPLAAELRAAFDKMLAVLPGEVRARHELAARAIHFSGMPPMKFAPRIWADLTAAMQANERVQLDYFVPAKSRSEAREVEPYLLVVRDREWFLVARTTNSRHFALFYLPRVRKLRRLGLRFERDAQFHAERYYELGFNAMHGSGKPAGVELRFAASHAHLADERAWAARQTLKRHRDGSVSVCFRTNALFEVERQALRYGGVVEVRAPAQLRNSVREAAERMSRAHAADS